MTKLKRTRRSAVIAVAGAAMLAALTPPAATFAGERVTAEQMQDAVDYYVSGNNYCFRLAPPSQAEAASEKEWTVVLLTSPLETEPECMLNSLMQLGFSRVKAQTTGNVEQVMKHPEDRREFFARFGAEIEKKKARALKVTRRGPLPVAEEVDLAGARDLTAADLQSLAPLEVWSPPSE